MYRTRRRTTEKMSNTVVPCVSMRTLMRLDYKLRLVGTVVVDVSFAPKSRPSTAVTECLLSADFVAEVAKQALWNRNL